MVDLDKLLHEISVAFTASCNLRTLLPRLTTGMSRYCSAVEVEVITLDRDERDALILAKCPETRRTWRGTRSYRFLHRQGVVGALWSDYIEPARLSTESIASQLKIAVGDAGLLTISFSTDIRAELGDEHTDILVESLLGHCRRLGQLDRLARHTRALHRDSGVTSPAPSPVSEPPPTPASTDEDNDISVEQTQLFPGDDTAMSVTTIDSALVSCISTALQATQGQIYGESGAAKLLGVKPSTLQSKMRKLGIERTTFTH